MARKRKKQSFFQRREVQWGLAALLVVVIAVLAFFIITSFQGKQATQGGTVVATVNGQPIYSADIMSQYDTLPASVRAQYSPEVILNQTIDKMLVLQEATKDGINATQAQVDQRIQQQAASLGINVSTLKSVLATNNVSFATYSQAVHDDLVLSDFVNQYIMPNVSVSEQEIRDYYQQHQSQYIAQPGEVRVRHILVPNQSEAIALRAEIMNGTDFGTVAKENSTDTGSASKGGELGFISSNSSIVEPFKSVALNLSVGEISQPVHTQYGWHLIQRESNIIPLSQVRSSINQTIQNDKARTLFNDLLVQLRSQATIVHLQDVSTLAPVNATG